MAVSPSVHVVTVGMAPAVGDAAPAAVAQALAAAGIPVAALASVDEEESALERVIAADGGVTVIIAGASGSSGDVVRRVVSRAAGTRLALNDRMLAALEERHRRRDRPLPRRDERLALLPQGATVWTAGDDEPGWTIDSARGLFIVLPRGAGMDRLVAEQVIPFVSARFTGRGAVVTRTLKTVGAPVTGVEERLAAWIGREGDVSVRVAPVDGEVWVRLRARGTNAADATQALASAEPEIRAVLGADYYGRDDDTLERVVGTLLADRHFTLSVAESCTGGLLGHRITTIPGSSAYFERGMIVYSNQAKMDLLGVPEDILRAHGAVSAPTAEAMARGACERSGSPCGLAITGIAGPDGGSAAKPVGTVFIGIAVQGDVSSRRFRFLGDRASIKWQSSSMALDMLRRKLGGDSR